MFKVTYTGQPGRLRCTLPAPVNILANRVKNVMQNAGHIHAVASLHGFKTDGQTDIETFVQGGPSMERGMQDPGHVVGRGVEDPGHVVGRQALDEGTLYLTVAVRVADDLSAVGNTSVLNSTWGAASSLRGSQVVCLSVYVCVCMYVCM